MAGQIKLNSWRETVELMTEMSRRKRVCQGWAGLGWAGRTYTPSLMHRPPKDGRRHTSVTVTDKDCITTTMHASFGLSASE